MVITPKDLQGMLEALEECAKPVLNCKACAYHGKPDCPIQLKKDAAEMIRRLHRAACKMHLWIFLNTRDEEKVYRECGLTDADNALFGYSGKMRLDEK